LGTAETAIPTYSILIPKGFCTAAQPKLLGNTCKKVHDIFIDIAVNLMKALFITPLPKLILAIMNGEDAASR